MYIIVWLLNSVIFGNQKDGFFKFLTIELSYMEINNQVQGVFMRIMCFCVLLVLSISVKASDASLYRWQDANGQWHFGDAASSHSQPAQAVDLAAETQNVVKTKKLKLAKPKVQAASKNKKSSRKKAESLADKKARCEQKRDELRFQAFRTEERNQYDRECVSAMKW